MERSSRGQEYSNVLFPAVADKPLRFVYTLVQLLHGLRGTTREVLHLHVITQSLKNILLTRSCDTRRSFNYTRSLP